MREFGSGSLVASYKGLARKDTSLAQNIELDLGVPTYSPKQFYLEACMDSETMTGGNGKNGGYVRVNRAIMRG